MLRIIVVLSLFTFSLGANAEKLLFKSDIFPSIKSGPILWLDSASEVYTYPSEDSWAKAVAFIYIMPDKISDARVIKRNTDLYNSRGILIGKTYETFTYEGFYHYSGNYIVLELNCFIPVGRFDPNSFIEKQVSDILNRYNNKLTTDSITAHLTENNYFRKDYNTDVQAYIFFESNKFNQRDDTRLKLVFYKGQLAAVMLKRKLNLNNFEAELDEGDFRIYYLRVLNQQEKEKMSFAFKNDR